MILQFSSFWEGEKLKWIQCMLNVNYLGMARRRSVARPVVQVQVLLLRPAQPAHPSLHRSVVLRPDRKGHSVPEEEADSVQGEDARNVFPEKSFLPVLELLQHVQHRPRQPSQSLHRLHRILRRLPLLHHLGSA